MRADTEVLDVGALPEHALGEPAPLWWGVILMVTIESTMFVVLLGTYLYLRNETAAWPPLGTDRPGQIPGAISTVLLLISVVPQWIGDRLAFDAPTPGRDRAIRWTLVAASLIGLVILIPRAFEFPALHCRWDTHAYGSIVWTMLGMHTFHLVTSTVETIVLTVYAFLRPMDEKHCLDLNVNALYWYFVVGWWLPIWAAIYLGPMVL